MAVPKYHELFNPVLLAMRQLGGSATIAELNNEVIGSLELPAKDLAVPHGNRGTEVEYRLAWARTYLKAYGLLQNSERGVWSLTADGRRTESVDPQRVVRQVRGAQRSRKLDQERDVIPAIEGDAVEEDWREQLRATLLSLSPSTFERLCQRLLRESGFIEVRVTGRSGDGGIDGVGIVRIGGLLGFPVLFQCKRYAGSVSASTIRDFRGAMVGRADRGIVITTGAFTRDARIEATRDGASPIDLIDGEELIDKLKEPRLGIEIKMVEIPTVDVNWFSSL